MNSNRKGFTLIDKTTLCAGPGFGVVLDLGTEFD